ncbi:hypothetical protein TPHA_0D01280 [Tetrapisispora phaffii CBS 4417]|uniref:Trimethylguanosine synthase n=1 Tax=Tetrapisispora phaffii (strain ATCC 24235 / CBS 4417 / NBRC 1672 / NRRL Y-8282 / UCD 70-5) TaxID=1071381 RepID=G8BSE8_TETPH|nr:hypothetical protein TPHA_0D01280 [Tetrapisispora phaffii CBS 4417]CCE62769.1 hypothetical protein TPHA_0D01280 [Tetrapisispora phaffii CBS 4417]
MGEKRLRPRGKKIDASHFLHIKKRKYKTQYQLLKKLYKDDCFKIDTSAPLQEKAMKKYWNHRDKLFSKIDSLPIYMTHELWFSVTPELIAKFIAKYVRACLPAATKVLDVFCGGGGNTIQFAKLFPKVYGVDFSIDHLYCTYRNAQSYGLADRIWLKYGSWTQMVKKGKIQQLGIDCIFGSPPWGGPLYLKSKEYDLENSLLPVGLTELLEGFRSVSENIILFLPKNSQLSQIAMATRKVFGVTKKCKIIHVLQNGFSKGLFCIWGDALINYETEDGGERDNFNKASTSHNTETNEEPTNDKGKAQTYDLNYDIDG